MRILCTNDDGIHAPGLKVVEDIARALSDDVWIVAPELDQSGVSHSLSLNDPLRLREVGPRHFAVRGTPTDCVIMGARHILGEKLPDLVLSGVNKGRNVAEDVVYSGTIAGALEGTILGIPSFALSQEFSIETRDAPLWDTALKFGPGYRAQGDRRRHAEEHRDQRQLSRPARPTRSRASASRGRASAISAS